MFVIPHIHISVGNRSSPAANHLQPVKGHRLHHQLHSRQHSDFTAIYPPYMCAEIAEMKIHVSSKFQTLYQRLFSHKQLFGESQNAKESIFYLFWVMD